MPLSASTKPPPTQGTVELLRSQIQRAEEHLCSAGLQRRLCGSLNADGEDEVPRAKSWTVDGVAVPADQVTLSGAAAGWTWPLRNRIGPAVPITGPRSTSCGFTATSWASSKDIDQPESACRRRSRRQPRNRFWAMFGQHTYGYGTP